MQSANSGIQIFNSVDEARRQLEICNACRYCEGYCAVFPAVHELRNFSEGDIEQLSNLCHNCRGCYYACQYTAPHEFALNLPKALAEVRQDSWNKYAFPVAFAGRFDKNGVAIALLSILALTFFLFSVQGSGAGNTFYDLLPHNWLVAVFLPAFILPLLTLVISLRRYWQAVDGKDIEWRQVKQALVAAGKMKHLDGGHGDGCNFEDEDRFSHARRHFHQATMWGFLLCFAATSVATLMHYLLNLPAPYSMASLPKLFGVSGGILLSVGTLGLMALKAKADRNLSDQRVWGGEMAFVALLFLVSTSGLLLWLLGGTVFLPFLLAFHLATVLTLFLLTPYSKMAHGFYRLAALIRNEQR